MKKKQLFCSVLPNEFGVTPFYGNYNYTNFCQFLAVLENSLIHVKFPPPIAWHILYTAKKKNENFHNFFFVLKVLKHIRKFFAKTCFIFF